MPSLVYDRMEGMRLIKYGFILALLLETMSGNGQFQETLVKDCVYCQTVAENTEQTTWLLNRVALLA